MLPFRMAPIRLGGGGASFTEAEATECVRLHVCVSQRSCEALRIIPAGRADKTLKCAV